MAAILIFAPSEDDISVRFLKNYILFSINSIKVRFCCKHPNFKNKERKILWQKLNLFFKYIKYVFRKSQEVSRDLLKPLEKYIKNCKILETK